MEPDNWWAHYFVGYVYEAMGRYGDAVAAFARSEALRPGSPEVQAELARMRRLQAAHDAAAGGHGPGEPALAAQSPLVDNRRRPAVSFWGDPPRGRSASLPANPDIEGTWRPPVLGRPVARGVLRSKAPWNT